MMDSIPEALMSNKQVLKLIISIFQSAPKVFTTIKFHLCRITQIRMPISFCFGNFHVWINHSVLIGSPRGVGYFGDSYMYLLKIFKTAHLIVKVQHNLRIALHKITQPMPRMEGCTVVKL